MRMLLDRKSETGYQTVERIVVFGEGDADYHEIPESKIIHDHVIRLSAATY